MKEELISNPNLGFRIRVIPNPHIQKGEAYLMIHPDDVPEEYKSKN